MKQRRKGAEADCILHLAFQLRPLVVWGCLFGGLVLVFAFSSSVHSWELIPGDEKGIWVKREAVLLDPENMLVKDSAKCRFLDCIQFAFIFDAWPFLPWIIENWLNMSTAQLNMNISGKFILCTPLPFYCNEKRKKNPKTRNSTGCNFNRSFQPVLTFTKFW